MRLARTPGLVPGILLDSPQIKLELTCERVGLSRKLSATNKQNRQTYYNVRPPVILNNMLLARVAGWCPGKTIGLHRLIVAASGNCIESGQHVHHRNHNHLDNRASNLEVINADAHIELHSRIPRLNDLQQPGFFGQAIFLTVTLKREFYEAFPPCSPVCHGDCRQVTAHVRVFSFPNEEAFVQVLHEPSNWTRAAEQAESPANVGGAVIDDAINGACNELTHWKPDYMRRIAQSKELQRIGLRARAARRARKMLTIIKQLGRQATAARIIEKVTAKMDSERSAWNTLDWLTSGGFIEKTESKTYQLTARAWRLTYIATA